MTENAPIIYVDADACPVKVAERLDLIVTFVSNDGLRPSRDPMIRNVVVSKGADADDDWIVENTRANDIAITADIPLAARTVALGAHVLGPTGKPFTPETIGMAVAMRNLKQHLRETGKSKGYNASFAPQDRSRFLGALDQDRAASPESDAAVMKPFGRHFIFLASAGIGVMALAVAILLQHPLSYSIAANAFFATYIVLLLREMPRLTADFLSRRAQQADEPIWIIFLVTIGIVVVAVGSLFVLMNAKQVPHPFWLAFSLLSLPLGWLTIPAMAALHYARLYWKGDSKSDATSTRSRKPIGGLIFPGTERPCSWDFLYFAVVIGMTAQTADTNISSKHMRQAALVHSILSFFFNTIIVAAAVNLVVSLAS